MKQTIFGILLNSQSILILNVGLILAIEISCALTNRFDGVVIPKNHKFLIG